MFALGDIQAYNSLSTSDSATFLELDNFFACVFNICYLYSNNRYAPYLEVNRNQDGYSCSVDSKNDWPKFCHRLAHNMLLGCSLCCFVLPTLPSVIGYDLFAIF